MVNINTVLNRLTVYYNSDKPFSIQDIEDSITMGIISELDVVRIDGEIVGVTNDGFWNLINVY